ncbi:MAG: flagellar biosynthetic protein FliO [Gammaproteobacteria bacterium]|nr:flagellar biosynthetic protein FliO [Gammaproteobacteria bacterium]
MKNSLYILILIVFNSTAVIAQEVDSTVSASPSATVTFLKVFFALAVTLFFIWGLAWFAKRYQKFSAPSQFVKVIGGVSLGQRERAILLQVGEVQILVGVSPGSVNTLHVLSENVTVPLPPSGESFAKRLAQGLKQRGGA